MGPATADRTAGRDGTGIGDAVLRVEDVRKSFRRGPPWRRRKVEVLRGAALEVLPGELVGLVGENGSGKSVLMQIIVGLLTREGGTVQRAARLGYCPQRPLLWPKLTVSEHLELALVTAGALAAALAVFAASVRSRA